jgi:hypothetical protein
MLLLLVFAAIFPFTFPWKDGKPMLSWSELKLPGMPEVEVPEITLPGSEEQARDPHQPLSLYRWQDSEGGAQFSNEPPPEGVAYQRVEVNPDANLLQAPPPAIKQESPSPQGETAPDSSLPSPLTVSPGEAMQLIEDAHEIREMSEQRLRQHEELTQ